MASIGSVQGSGSTTEAALRRQSSPLRNPPELFKQRDILRVSADGERPRQLRPALPRSCENRPPLRERDRFAGSNYSRGRYQVGDKENVINTDLATGYSGIGGSSRAPLPGTSPASSSGPTLRVPITGASVKIGQHHEQD